MTRTNLIDAVGVGPRVAGADKWMMQAGFAITQLRHHHGRRAQASELMQCVADGFGYL